MQQISEMLSQNGSQGGEGGSGSSNRLKNGHALMYDAAAAFILNHGYLNGYTDSALVRQVLLEKGLEAIMSKEPPPRPQHQPMQAFPVCPLPVSTKQDDTDSDSGVSTPLGGEGSSRRSSSSPTCVSSSMPTAAMQLPELTCAPHGGSASAVVASDSEDSWQGDSPTAAVAARQGGTRGLSRPASRGSEGGRYPQGSRRHGNGASSYGGSRSTPSFYSHSHHGSHPDLNSRSLQYSNSYSRTSTTQMRGSYQAGEGGLRYKPSRPSEGLEDGSRPEPHLVKPAPSTDLERFLIQAMPMLPFKTDEPVHTAIRSLTLDDIWKFYHEPSLYGREVWTLGGQRGPSHAYFVPYLSAMQLFTPATPGDPGSKSLYVCDVEGWPRHMHLMCEHLEEEPPFNRMPMYDMLQMLSEQEPLAGGPGEQLRTLPIADLHPASWYAVAWYPVYRIPDAPLTTRFLTYHSIGSIFSILQAGKEGLPAPGMLPLQVVGVKWNNMQNERWLEHVMDTPPSDGRDQAAGGGKGATPAMPMDPAWNAHLSELQATAERLSRGGNLRVLGQMGAEPARLRHSDFEFFVMRA